MRQADRYAKLLEQAEDLRDNATTETEEDRASAALNHLFRLELAGTLGNSSYTTWNRKQMNLAQWTLDGSIEPRYSQN